MINNDVLNSLGPGPAPLAPLPPATLPQAVPPQAAPAPGLTPTFNIGSGNTRSRSAAPQPQGNGAFVVTRPGTLLFPPLREPSSSLTPGFATEAAREQRKQAFDNAFAEGPEPQSQLLLPLANAEATAPADQGEWVFETVIIESKPVPQPAQRKPEPSAAMLATLEEAEQQEPGLQEAVDQGLPPVAVETALLPANEDLAPEFREPVRSDSAVEAPVAEPAMAEAPAVEATEPATRAVQPLTDADRMPVAEMPDAAPADMPSQSVAAANDTADSNAPLSLLPADQAAATAEMTEVAAAPEPAAVEGPAGETSVSVPLQQTASLSETAGLPLAVDDISFIFDPNSAELTTSAQETLRSLADDLRDKGGDRIQVLGFASSTDGSADLARQLALSRALKVRTFLIDAGIPSARIQVRPPSGTSGSGPANRVDIKPVGS
ncbi:OmpA family protein [Pelagibius litoralis]|uniref:OmpA family protein n=1 Tax=Pelagibius litoralis TaxID=374515 RepID=A0A967EZW5_9PROT|nr:OmpA family protein [Pelagibius litoralis]NIA70511.1 OmpA family protein [Pelagibius litoralis]